MLWWLGLVSAKLVYFIRHGEKPEQGPELNELGIHRSLCLAQQVFSGEPQFSAPQRILAQPSTSKVQSKRPVDTVVPLAKALNVTIEQSCERDDLECVINLIKQDNSTLLISWEHKRLANILSLWTGKTFKYPKYRFDLVWILDTLNNTVLEFNENCDGYVQELQAAQLNKPKCGIRQYFLVG